MERFTDFKPVVFPPNEQGVVHFGFSYRFDGVKFGAMYAQTPDVKEHELALAADRAPEVAK